MRQVVLLRQQRVFSFYFTHISLWQGIFGGKGSYEIILKAFFGEVECEMRSEIYEHFKRF